MSILPPPAVPFGRSVTGSDASNVAPVLIARIVAPEVGIDEAGQDFEDRINLALDTDRPFELLNLRWVILQRRWVDQRYIFGTLAAFNDIRGAFPGLPFVEASFVVDSFTPSIAIQLANPELTVGTAIDVFTGIMSLGRAQSSPWRLRTMGSPTTLAEWLKSASSVEALNFQLRPPNPSYKERRLIEAILESAEAGTTDITLLVRGGRRTLRTDSRIISEAADHVDLGYGQSVAKGSVTTDEGESVPEEHHSRLNGKADLGIAPIDEGTGRMDHETMSEELRRLEEGA